LARCRRSGGPERRPSQGSRSPEGVHNGCTIPRRCVLGRNLDPNRTLRDRQPRRCITFAVRQEAATAEEIHLRGPVAEGARGTHGDGLAESARMGLSWRGRGPGTEGPREKRQAMRFGPDDDLWVVTDPTPESDIGRGPRT